MRKIYSYFFLVGLTISMLIGCSDPSMEDRKEDQSTSVTENHSFPLTVRDAVGERVTVNHKPERIISLMPSNTETVFALGLGEKVIGVSDNDNYPKETKGIEKVGGMAFDIEKIMSLQPDLVLAHESVSTLKEGVSQLEDTGIPVLTVNDAHSFKDVYASIEMIGQATGERGKAKDIVEEMKNKLEKIKQQAKGIKEEERKSVFVEISPSPEIYTTGKNTFMDEMLSLISADNVSGDLEGWVKLDEESVIAANPDVIITTYGYDTRNAIEEVLGRKGWSGIKAVKNKEVYDVHPDLVTRSGPRLIEGVEELAKSIYPNVFDK